VGSALRAMTRPLASRTEATVGLMDVEADILGRPFHESRSWLGTTGWDRLHGSAEGRTLNMR
jgi:hypothetical protein